MYGSMMPAYVQPNLAQALIAQALLAQAMTSARMQIMPQAAFAGLAPFAAAPGISAQGPMQMMPQTLFGPQPTLPDRSPMKPGESIFAYLHRAYPYPSTGLGQQLGPIGALPPNALSPVGTAPQVPQLAPQGWVADLGLSKPSSVLGNLMPKPLFSCIPPSSQLGRFLPFGVNPYY
jgi:hypothetical protein